MKANSMVTPDGKANITLLVSNQSYDITPVDIEVFIDGRLVVKDMFDVQGDQLPQHNWQRYQQALQRGSHRLVAKSQQGHAELEISFEVPAVQTVTIAYWYGRRSVESEPEGYFTIEAGAHQASTM